MPPDAAPADVVVEVSSVGVEWESKIVIEDERSLVRTAGSDLELGVPKTPS